MPLKDRFDLPVTCNSAPAVDNYVAAVDLLLAAWPGAEARLDRALAADPDFALAHIARARLLQLQARIPEAKAEAALAQSLADRVTAREHRHIEAITQSIDGAADNALAIVRAHAAEYPRDALPLSLVLGVFGLLGFSGRRDHHEAKLAMQRMAPSLSRIGCRITTGPGICTATCPGTWHCSSWRVATPSAPVRSTSTISGLRWHRRCRCWCSPTRHRFCGVGGTTIWGRRWIRNGRRWPRMRGVISRVPVSPLPISMPLSPKPLMATRRVCSPGSADCRPWPAMADC